MDATKKTKAEKQLQKCNFCGEKTTPTERAGFLFAYKCKACGAIGAARQDPDGGYSIAWTIPDREQPGERLTWTGLLAKQPPELLREYVRNCEKDGVKNTIVRQQCNLALKRKGLSPEF